MMQHRNIAVGDILPAAPGREIVSERGCRRWHALLVYPQREVAGRVWLQRRGVYAFFPVERQVRVVRGKRIERSRRYLPGYLFALFPHDPIWHRILDSPETPNPFFRDVIRLHSGEAGRLHPRSIRALAEMRETDERIVERRRAARLPRQGDRVRLRTGPLEDHIGEVVELTAGTVRLKVKMFASEVPVQAKIEHVERLGAWGES